jgi:hypothetical protein
MIEKKKLFGKKFKKKKKKYNFFFLRVADGMLNGPPARCPECFGGHLHLFGRTFKCKFFFFILFL